MGAVHGDLGQAARETSLNAFRANRVDILVATDVAARGIDVDDVTHVINFQTPDDPMTYVHRIGRTGRAGHSGTAVTLVGYDELQKWRIINDELQLDNPEPPQWFSTSPELFSTLDIPEDAPDEIGVSKRVYGLGPGAGLAKPRGARNTRGTQGGRNQRSGDSRRSHGSRSYNDHSHNNSRGNSRTTRR